MIHGGDIYNNKVRLDFSSNINPLGMPKNALSEIEKCRLDIYPDDDCSVLKQALGKDNVIFGAGAADLIFRLVLAKKPKRALIISPSFAEYERALKSVGCEIIKFYLNESLILDESIIGFLENIDMLFICNPNNPAGNTVSKELMLKISDICSEKNIILAVDECFMDFCENGYSMEGRAVVIKAFTKIYAMAGLRLGYIIADEKTIEEIKEVSPPWSVSSIAQHIGANVLRDSKFINGTISYVKKERLFLSNILKNAGFFVYPSETNFILFKGTHNLYNKFFKKGILIRDCENFGLKDHFRIAVRTHEENKIFEQTLLEVLNG